MTFKRLRETETDSNRVKKINEIVDALNSSTSETLAEHEAAADPHPQYLLQTEGETIANAAVAAHNAVGDPHPQYLTPAEGNAAYDALGAAASAVSTHEGLTDPHPGYLTPAEGNAAYDALGAASTAVADHVAAADPHTQYAKKIDYGQRAVSLNATAIAMTAAVDSTLATNTDYVQVTGIYTAVPDGVNSGITQQTNSFTIARSGFYRIEFWASARAGANNTQIGFKFAVNGVIGLVRRPKIFMRNSNETHTGAAFGYAHFNAGDVLTLHIASTNTTDITIEDAVFGAHSMNID